MIEAVRKDYPQGLAQFKEEMKKKYPEKNIDGAIRTCTDPCWKNIKQNFLMSPSLPLYAMQAVALEKAIQTA